MFKTSCPLFPAWLPSLTVSLSLHTPLSSCTVATSLLHPALHSLLVFFLFFFFLLHVLNQPWLTFLFLSFTHGITKLCPTLCNLWTVAHQTRLCMGCFKQEYWSGLPFPPPGDLPHPGIEPASPVSSVLADGFSTTEPPGKPTTHGPCSKCVAISCLPIRVKGSISLVLVILHATVSSCLEVVLLYQLHEACKRVLSEQIPSNEPLAKQRIVTSGKRRSSLLKTSITIQLYILMNDIYIFLFIKKNVALKASVDFVFLLF